MPEEEHIDASLTVLMATLNGGSHISAQIASIARQTDEKIELIVSDDGSSDDTLASIEEACRDHAHISLITRRGPSLGYAANFRDLVLNTEPKGRFIAFCDQDDVWFDDKHARSKEWLSQHENEAALFCGRTQNIDEAGNVQKVMSPHFWRKPAFENAIVQSLAGGNTMTFNRRAFALLRTSLRDCTPVSHDWWAYQLISGAGGKVGYSSRPLVYYRQHAANLIGSNRGLVATKNRLAFMLKGRFRRWNEVNLKALTSCESLLTSHARTLVSDMKRVQEGGLFERLWTLRKSRIYRQTRTGHMMMYVACAIRRL